MMPLRPLQILFEDNHCLVVCKPAGLLTAGDATGDSTLLDCARQYVKERYGKPGDVYLGVVHRLDRPVSGVVLLARTSKAAARLSEQFRAGTVRKSYVALVEGKVDPAAGTLVDWLVKEESANMSEVVSSDTEGAKRCELDYRTLAAPGGATLVEITPRTGRSHQIRVQLSSRGWPIVGDAKYGSRRRMSGRIALHATSLQFEHPTLREPVTVVAPYPAAWETDSTGRD